MDFSHQISFIGPVPNFTLPSLNLFVTVSQRQLSAVLPQGNTHTPLTLFFPSKKLIDLNYGTPAVWVITLFPYISMIPYNRSFPVAPRFPVPPAYFPSCVHWCRGSSAGRSAVTFMEEPSQISLGQIQDKFFFDSSLSLKSTSLSLTKSSLKFC